jgi:hypothetical protein
MSSIEHLREQEARARRLAGTITDATTIERFLEFAASCREQIAAMSAISGGAEPAVGAAAI